MFAQQCCGEFSRVRRRVVWAVGRAVRLAVLIRAYADQARRSDAVDATLGVVLGAAIAALSVAFQAGQGVEERAIALLFILPIVIMAEGLMYDRIDPVDGVQLSRQIVRDVLRGTNHATHVLASAFEDAYRVTGIKRARLQLGYLVTAVVGLVNVAVHIARAS